MKFKPNAINLKKYLPFFQENANCVCALGLVHSDGQLNTLAHSSHSDDFGKLLEFIEHPGHDPHNAAHARHFIDLDSHGSLTKVALMFPHWEQPCWLAGLLKTPTSTIDNAHRTKLFNTLDTIAECIVDDYTTHMIVTNMADELAVRYEELNLIYGLEENESDVSSINENEALNHLIHSCIYYLNVDLAVLYAPDLDLSFHQLSAKHPDNYLASALNTCQNSLYRYILSTKTTLVINQNRDIDWSDANLNLSEKIIAAPIKLGKDHFAGILVLINTPEKPDFSNSDRKLCEVLASEAGRLIQARRDNVTSLLNRRGFTEKLQQALITLNDSVKKYSLLFIDIDQFKIINDTSGQKAGDQLLNHIGNLITKEIGSNLIGRLGADEFGVVLENFELDAAKKAAEHLCRIINQFRFSYQDKLYEISVCIGVTELPLDCSDFSVPLSSAHLACNVAKEQGRNRVHIYHSSDKETIRHESQMQWVSRINLALDQERFQIYRQKILPLNEGIEEEHYEILLRLKDEKGNLIPPFNFIPAAERYNLMTQLDRWVVKNALAKMAAVFEAVPESKLSCSINLSGQSYCEPGFVEFVMEQINQYNVSPNRICFEITETAAVSNLSQTVKFMEMLKDIGCYFSLDDFGSGMSSFTYLKNLPVDYLKIDGYFVKTMLSNSVDYAMVKSINEIGHVMGLKTIAEFIENDQILKEIKAMGIDYGQGYGIGIPEPFD